MPLSKDSLGLPGQGFHKHFLGVAILDVVGTAALGYGVSYLTGWSPGSTILGTFIAGELIHYFVGVDTAVMKLFRGGKSASPPVIIPPVGKEESKVLVL